MTGALTVRDIAERLNDRAGDLAAHLLPGGRRRGRTFVEASRARGGLGDSLVIEVDGPKRGLWYHHGEQVGGDMLKLLEYVGNCDIFTAVQQAKAFLAIEDGQPPPPRERRSVAPAADDTDKRRAALRLWRKRRALPGTPGQAYLAARGAPRFYDSDALGYLPECWHDFERRSFPALICRVVGPTGAFRGLWRIYLDPDRPAKAAIELPRLGLGSVRGGAVHLRECGKRLGICEGVETGIKVEISLRGLPVWPCLSTAGLVNLDLPGQVEEVLIFADHDRAKTRPDGSVFWPGQDAARAGARRFRDMGRGVSVIMPGPAGADFDDVPPLAPAPVPGRI